MQRNGDSDVAVADILAEAGMSTRSFYRHFESKDQLLCALYRHEAEQVAERLTARVSGAASPLAALDSWIEEIMSLGYHRRKAARVAVLGSPGAMRAEGYADESARAMKLLIAPLRAVLADGLRDGTFPLADPASDAPLVQSVVWAAAGLNPFREPVRARGGGVPRGAIVLLACARRADRDTGPLIRGFRHPPVLLAQQPLEQLAAVGPRQLRHEVNRSRALVAS